MKNKIEELIQQGLNNSPEYKKNLDQLARQAEKSKSTKAALKREFDAGLNGVGQRIESIAIREQLSEILNMVSLSYIAEHYFDKNRHWLYQKINGNIVNGKPKSFTKDEMIILNKALKDMGKKIGSVKVVS